MLLVLAVGLTFVGATKTNRTGSVSSPLLNDSQTARRVTALTQSNVDPTDTARFLDIDVATNGTVSLVAHRPPESATLSQDVVFVATTNLCTPTWFALTNTAFAAGETNALGAVTSYVYDAFGRVTQKTVVAEGLPTETTISNAVEGTAFQPTFDVDGNQTSASPSLPPGAMPPH